jgi:hypothetical protein
MGMFAESPGETKIREPLGRWVEHLLESIIKLNQSLEKIKNSELNP